MEKTPISLVVFDMAGTTVDEDNVVYKTLQQAVNSLGHRVGLDEVLLLGAGKEKLQAIKDILANGHAEAGQVEAQARSAFRAFRLALEQAYTTLEVKTFPGTPDLFRLLRGHGIGVVLNTGYDRRTAERLIAKLGWAEGREFDLLITADDVKRGRPAPDMILLAMDRLGVTDPQHVAKVGDSIVDVEEGKAAGCGLTVGVTTGAQTAEQLRTAHPDRVIRALPEMTDLIALA